MESLKERLAKNLQILRKIEGLSQARLAEMAGISIQVVRRIETSSAWPDYASLEAISSVLRIDPKILFEDPSKKLGLARGDPIVADPRLKDLLDVASKLPSSQLDNLIRVARVLQTGELINPYDLDLEPLKKKSR